MLSISVDQNGVKMTSKGKPKNMNKVEEQVVVALMSVVKLFLEQASQQIGASLKAQETTDKLIKSVEETLEDADGIEGIKRAFIAEVAAKEGGAILRGPDGSLIGGGGDATGDAGQEPTNIAGDNVVKFPASNGTGDSVASPDQPQS
jgi:hypothetical protein